MTRQGGGLLAMFRACLPVTDITPRGESDMRIAAITLVNVYLPPPNSPWRPRHGVTPEQHFLELLLPEVTAGAARPLGRL